VKQRWRDLGSWSHPPLAFESVAAKLVALLGRLGTHAGLDLKRANLFREVSMRVL